MMNGQATSAVNRFGLGARPGELQGIDADPRGWLLAQLRASQRISAFDGLPDSRDYLGQYADYLQQRRDMRAEKTAGKQADRDALQAGGRRDLQRGVLRELVARQRVAVASEDGFRERLVRFWSNHFAISVDKFRASLFAAPM